MKPKPFMELKNLTVPWAFSPVNWRCGPPLKPPASRGAPSRGAADADDLHRLTLDLEVGRRNAPAAIDQSELQRLTVGEVGQTRLLDCRNVDEYIFAAVIADDEAEALLRIEEFYDALALANDLGRHSAARTAAAETAAATAAAATEATASAAAVAATAAAAAAIATATAAAGTIAEATAATGTGKAAAVTETTVKACACELFTTTETVALITAATTAVTLTPSIETHEF